MGLSPLTTPLRLQGAMGLQDPDDVTQLLRRVASRDRAAFDALYDAAASKLFGLLLRLLKDRAEAEDALQDVFLKIWRRSETFDVDRAADPIHERARDPARDPAHERARDPVHGRALGWAWMLSVARNDAIDRLRARRAPTLDLEAAPEPVDQAPGPEAAAMAQSERAKIEHCLDRLDPDKADAVRRAYLDGASYKDLAARHDVPLNTMRTWLRRSLQKLKDCLEE